jgi:hypothetical protein
MLWLEYAKLISDLVVFALCLREKINILPTAIVQCL